VCFAEIARRTPRYSGADLAALIREATLLVLDDLRSSDDSNKTADTLRGKDTPRHTEDATKESGEETGQSDDNRPNGPTPHVTNSRYARDVVVEMAHFTRSLATVLPSVNIAQLEIYEQFHATMGRTMI
jgi:SpoVK/Ycf46/Vps4 family AAA+-type ATPase